MKSADASPNRPENTPPQKPASADASWREKLQSGRAPCSIPHRDDRLARPLSFLQERLWFLDQLEPGNPVFNRPLALRLTGSLDDSGLRQAVQTILDRHEVLRAHFKVQDGLPELVISHSLALDVRIVEISEGDAAERELRARHWATQEALRPFDLAQGPLMRATLLQLGEREHILLAVFHHIVFDGWSAEVFIGEFTHLYRDFMAGTPPTLGEIPIQYADFAHWQRLRADGELAARQLDYWEKQLSGCVPVDLPTDRPRPSVQSHRGGSTELLLQEPLVGSLRALSQREDATLFMTLLGAFLVLLARYTGSGDIVVGSFMAGRDRIETEKLIGLFLNTVVLRADLSGNPTFRQLLGRVRQTCRGAYTHQDLPFEVLLGKLRPARDRGTTPLFQVAFNYENLPKERTEIPGLRIEEFQVDLPVAACDLTLEIVHQAGQLKASFTYNADLFDRGGMERMARHYRTLLEGIITDPETPIASLPLLTDTERHQILFEWNRTEVEYPHDATVQALFEVQAERSPAAIALTFQDQTMTYGDLNRRANRLVRQLRDLGVKLESRVGICMERSLEMVVGLLATLKAGGACVPLDPAYPPERLTFMVEDSAIKILLTQRRLRPTLPKGDFNVVCLDDLDDTASTLDHVNPPMEGKADNVAYVLYTSGSTGKPKGAEVLHRGIVRLVFGTDFVRFGKTEVFLQISSTSFDAALLEIWGALLHGGRCVLFPSRIPDLPSMRAILRDEGVTTMMLTPALFNTVIDDAPEVLVPVPQLMVSGDVASVPHICRALSLLPDTQLVNAYGPTESTTYACAYQVPRSQSASVSSIPIGRPIANTKIYILDPHLQPVPIGVAGELYIGGDGLARGYFNRPEITRQRFIPNPFSTQPGACVYKTGDLCRYLPDGNIEFLGRLDHQVKIRGYRIELGEIESALLEHPLVSSAAVVARGETPGEKHLVAYIVPRASETQLTSKVWRDFLKAKLPDYMVPSACITLDAMPMTPSGKVARRALPLEMPEPQAQDRYVEPRDVLEWQLAEIWEGLLNVHPIGIQHDFFDLGGHSLLAVRMMRRIEDVCGQCLPLATLFEEATIQHLAKCLQAQSRIEIKSPIMPLQSEGSNPPFFFLHGDSTGGLYCRRLARSLGPEQPFYAVMPNGFDGAPLLPSIEAMAEENIRQLVAIQPRGPYLLGGFCNGGHVAYEMARQMEQQGREVGLVILLDAAVPPYFGWLKAFIRGVGWLARVEAEGQDRAYGRLRNYVLRAKAASRQGLGPLLALPLQTVRRKALLRLGTPPEELGIPGPAFDDPLESMRDQRFGAILMNYRPKPFRGRVVLLQTSSLLYRYPTDPTAGWGKLVSQVDVHELPGDHVTCRTQHIGVVAEYLRSYLDAFQGEGQRTQTRLGPT